MRPSSLQLMEMRFLGVSITPRDEPDVLKQPPEMDGFNFEDTSFSTSISHNIALDDPDSPLSVVMVDFHFMLPNDGNNPPPYICDIRCVGYFSIVKEAFPNLAMRFNVAVVNGASMLYGIVREMVANITARSWSGTMLLPTAIFHDNEPYDSKKEGLVEVERQKPENTQTAKKAPKKVSRKPRVANS